MSHRHWFYLAIFIVIAGLLALGAANSNILRRQRQAIEAESLAAQQQQLGLYLAKQTDGHKLVRLAKQMKNGDPNILKAIIDRAYALNPTDRDIVVLASFYNPELKSKVLELDPLYKFE